jgi:hypothetical protein
MAAQAKPGGNPRGTRPTTEIGLVPRRGPRTRRFGFAFDSPQRRAGLSRSALQVRTPLFKPRGRKAPEAEVFSASASARAGSLRNSRLGGGGGSLVRTRLCAQSPCLVGKLQGSRPDLSLSAGPNPCPAPPPADFRPISLGSEAGNFCRRRELASPIPASMSRGASRRSRGARFGSRSRPAPHLARRPRMGVMSSVSTGPAGRSQAPARIGG